MTGDKKKGKERERKNESYRLISYSSPRKYLWKEVDVL